MNGIVLVPRSPLLFWFGVIALPFSVLGAVYPDAAGISLGLILGLLVAALWDAGRAVGRLDGVSVELPPLLRLAQGRPAVVPVTVHNASRREARLRLDLAWPAPLGPAREDRVVVLPSGVDR